MQRLMTRNRLIQERDRKIEDLNSEIRQRGEYHRQLKERLDDLLLTVGDTTSRSEKEKDSAIKPEST